MKSDYDDAEMTSPTSDSTRPTAPLPSHFTKGPTSPIRFATTTNAFGLIASPGSSSSSSSNSNTQRLEGFAPINPAVDFSSNGTVLTRRLRRPSMLSLAQTPSFISESSQEEEVTATGPGPPEPPPSSSAELDFIPQPPPQPTPRWGPPGFLVHPSVRRVSTAPPMAIEALSTTTPPIPDLEKLESSGSNSPMEIEMDDDLPRSPLRWVPTHLQSASSRRKGKYRMEGEASDPSLHPPPFVGRPLPGPLLATLISESSPLEHEMRSEARLQRLISSHPSALPLTPRAPRSSRGRFPEMVGGDDDEDDDDCITRRWGQRSWTGRRPSSSESDSDDESEAIPGNDVNSAFAAGMDMDRPSSSSGDVGKWTPVQNIPTPPSLNAAWPSRATSARMSFGSAGAGLVPSPGGGLGLPGAFGGLGMGGIGTPLGSPTIEKLELAASPGAVLQSPGMMQYRDSPVSASVRPGKRKAQAEDRFDPYKRPRGSSPSLLSSPAYPLSPSRTSAMPIPSSPGHALLRHGKPGHPYTRPMSSRSRAASPALSTSLGNGRTGLAGAFMPLPPAGGLGLLSLAKGAKANPMIRENSEESREGMEED
ncbi:hypothetical protein P7C73_g4262, partial [Tremellales sp. Uapishka_1]